MLNFMFIRHFIQFYNFSSRFLNIFVPWKLLKNRISLALQPLKFSFSSKTLFFSHMTITKLHMNIFSHLTLCNQFSISFCCELRLKRRMKMREKIGKREKSHWNVIEEKAFILYLYLPQLSRFFVLHAPSTQFNLGSDDFIKRRMRRNNASDVMWCWLWM